MFTPFQTAFGRWMYPFLGSHVDNATGKPILRHMRESPAMPLVGLTTDKHMKAVLADAPTMESLMSDYRRSADPVQKGSREDLLFVCAATFAEHADCSWVSTDPELDHVLMAYVLYMRKQNFLGIWLKDHGHEVPEELRVPRDRPSVKPVPEAFGYVVLDAALNP